MAKARIEYVRLGYGAGIDGVAENVIRSFHGAVELAVSTPVTAAGSRPVVPEFGQTRQGYALIRALEGNFVVAWGSAASNPTATLLAGKLLKAGDEVAILVKTDELLSFLEVA